MRAFLHRSPMNAPLALKGNTVIKGYVRNSRERPILGSPSKVVIEWEPHPEAAMVWGTKEQAERACRNFASLDFSVDGCHYKNFRVEQISVAQFVVAFDCVTLAPVQL